MKGDLRHAHILAAQSNDKNMPAIDAEAAGILIENDLDVPTMVADSVIDDNGRNHPQPKLEPAAAGIRRGVEHRGIVP